jgi:hypothetical protein
MLAGAGSAIGLYAAMKIVHVFNLPLGPFSKLALSLLLFAAGGFAGGRVALGDGGTLRAGVVAFGALLLGVALGVVFWNGLEDYVLSRVSATWYEERKLFPVDVILLWMLGWKPLLVGLAAGMFIAFGPSRKPR